MKNRILIIDFDSTFVTKEALDELAAIVLSGRKDKDEVLRSIKEITKLGMEGKITFPQSLAQRLALFYPNRKDIKELIVLLQKFITPSIARNKQFFIENADNIYILSGGFKEYIWPVVEEFGFRKDHVLANSIVFDKKSTMIDFSRDNPLTKEKGKVKTIVKMNFNKPILVVGDGYTDFEIKEAGLAEKFIAFVENIARKNVIKNADIIANTFEEVIEIL